MVLLTFSFLAALLAICSLSAKGAWRVSEGLGPTFCKLGKKNSKIPACDGAIGRVKNRSIESSRKVFFIGLLLSLIAQCGALLFFLL